MAQKGPLKSIILSGNLNQNLKYQLCPVTEFSEGVWNITVCSIGYSCVENFFEHCEISCNLSKAQKFNEAFQVETYNQPFGLFLLHNGKRTIYFDKNWLYLNSHSNELQIFISKVNSNEVLKLDCNVFVHCLFQRVK